MPSPIPFEIHITIANLPVHEQDRFVQFCRQQHTKPILIELAKGDFTQQPMLTAVVHATRLNEALQAANNYTAQLNKAGFITNRLKIEIPANCADGYKDDTQDDFGKYYEWHGKINYINADNLLALCMEHKVHLSINALKNDPGYRFITLREFSDEAIFTDRINRLGNSLKAGGWQLTKQQAEYCIYDTNHLLDTGWLPQ